MGRSVLRTGVVLVVLAALAIVLNFTLSDVSRANDLGEIVQISVTVFAIVTGGIFAYDKLQIFRDFKPHLTITLESSHRIVSESYVHIAVAVNLKNNSKVRTEILEGLFRLQHIAPLIDDDVEYLYRQVFATKEADEIRWPLLAEDQRTWERNELVVEPGESHQETVEFIVETNVESVLVYTYFFNSRFSPGSTSAQGWGATSAHDIIAGNQ